jgi:hypothetical protein
MRQDVAAEQGRVDPMHQFMIEPMFGTDHWQIAGYNIAFTNSALWMAIATGALLLFMWGGMKRQLVPGRWQMAVESMTGFIDNLLVANIGPAGKKYVPYIFSLFMFILFANVLGLLPIGIVGLHPFTFTSHFTVTGVLAVMSFAIVLIVGFWRHDLAAVADPDHRADLVPRPPVQPRAAAVRGDDGRARAAEGAFRLRHHRDQFGPAVGHCGRHPQLRADDRDLRARNPRRGHPGLRLRAAHLALSQRRREPSLSSVFHHPVSLGSF